MSGNCFFFSDDEHQKIRVEIKPLGNGTGPISASVDELRATVENLSLSPLGTAPVRPTPLLRLEMR